MSCADVDIDDDPRKLRGSGWEGNLDELRASRVDAAKFCDDVDFDLVVRVAGLKADRHC